MKHRSKKGEGDKQVSAKESLVFFYKVQQLFGSMGEKARVTMLQAGIRNPKAPIYYLVARTLIPFLLVTIAWIVLASSEREISRGVVFMVLVGMAGAGFFLPRLLIKNHIIKRQQEIGLTFPDALDMMLICVQGGIGLEQTIDRIADEISEHAPTLAEELGILSAEMGMLNDPPRRAAGICQTCRKRRCPLFRYRSHSGRAIRDIGIKRHARDCR